MEKVSSQMLRSMRHLLEWRLQEVSKQASRNIFLSTSSLVSWKLMQTSFINQHWQQKTPSTSQFDHHRQTRLMCRRWLHNDNDDGDASENADLIVEETKTKVETSGTVPRTQRVRQKRMHVKNSIEQDDKTSSELVRDLNDESGQFHDSTARLEDVAEGDEDGLDMVNEYEKSENSKRMVSALQPTDVVYGGQIDKFLDEMGMVYETGYTCYHTTCPKFPKVSARKKRDEGLLYINCHSGYFQCDSCGASGSWAHLRDNIQAIRAKKANRLWSCLNNVPEMQKKVVEMPAVVARQLEQSHGFSSLPAEQFDLMMSMFDWHGIHKKTFEDFNVRYRIQDNEYSVIFPIYSLKGVITGYRLHKGVLSETGDVKLSPVHTLPRGQDVFDIFGWQRKCSSSDLRQTLVITLGEASAMAIYQETGIKTLALRNLNTLPQEILPVLENYTKIILWLGTDVKAWENTKTFAKKLNERRCYIFRPTMVKKMPVQMLSSGERLQDVLREARLITHQAILTFSNLRQEVYHEIAFHKQAAGTQWKRYTKLNELLKGHRRGELTVLTGPTGCGKTTLLSEYSLDLCMQGVNTLWGSFEISNVRLIKIMMQQFAGKNLTKSIDEFDEIADEFAQLPMFFMSYYGQEQIAKVLEAMSHAVYVHDISHVIVDNLQFMMGCDYSEINRFVKQDRVVGMFRSFATEKNCHVTLIIHPRKVNEGEELSTASIFGSAKVSQEADNVLLIQDQRLVKPAGRKYLQIAKNRFDGDLGVMTLTFNKESLSFILKDKNPRPVIKEDSEDVSENLSVVTET